MSLLSESYKHLCGKAAEKLRKNCGKIAESNYQYPHSVIIQFYLFAFF